MTCNIKRRASKEVAIDGVSIGANCPIMVQSMTNTDTADVASTVAQIIELADAGSEIVRITVNNEESAAAVAEIRAQLDDNGYDVPIVGDFHYNGHRLLEAYPECAKALAKYRINPGNVGFGEKKDKQFTQMIELAIKYDKPVRIGVNWGSLDQELLQNLLDKNAAIKNPKELSEIQREALIESALSSAKMAEKIGLSANKIIVSCKVSDVQELVKTYRDLAKKCNYALHLGLTEAGIGIKGMVASTAALSILLQEGIGDTIRVSITPEQGASRIKEVIVAQEILQSLGLRSFTPQVTSCPGCGRTTSDYFQKLAGDIQDFTRDEMTRWKTKYEGVENLKLAVMGCIVNGPGESKHADIGISLPGTGESPAAPVFIDGKKTVTLRGDNITQEFKEIVVKYVEEKYNKLAISK